MKIAFIAFVTHFGGATRSTVEFASRLQEHAEISMVDVYGCCEPFRRAIEGAGLKHHVLLPRNYGTIIAGNGLLGRCGRIVASMPHLFHIRHRAERLLSQINPSIVIANQFKCASLVGFSWRLRNTPLVLYMRGWYTPDMMPLYGKWLCRVRSAGVLALSHATKSALICSGVEHSKVHVLHNPIDVSDYIARSQRPLERRLPQSKRRLRILLPADIIRTKGQHTAVEAMKYILNEGHDAVLWLAGEHAWPHGDNEHYLRDTQRVAERLGVAERVEWLGRRDDMPQVMAAASTVIFPSHTEGQGRVLLEAMSLAKPVAACPSGGILDMVCDGVTGKFFDIDDAQGLADCVDLYARNKELADKVGRQAQEYVAASFKPEQQVTRALMVFRRILKARQGG